MNTTETDKGWSTAKDIENVVRSAFREHLPEYKHGHWKFKWDGAKTRFGSCNHITKTISLSKVLNIDCNRQLHEIQNTILHEIAHALTPGHKHDATWRRVARSIGCNGERCSTLATPLKRKHYGKCKNGHEFKRHRKPKTGGVCAVCCNMYNRGRYSDEYQIMWETE